MRGKIGLMVLLLGVAALVLSEGRSYGRHHRRGCGSSCGSCSTGCASGSCNAAPAEASPSDATSQPAPPAPAGAAVSPPVETHQDAPSVASSPSNGRNYSTRRARRAARR